jgi:hypothetical protein
VRIIGGWNRLRILFVVRVNIKQQVPDDDYDYDYDYGCGGDRDGPRNFGLMQTPNAADSPRIHRIQSPLKLKNIKY